MREFQIAFIIFGIIVIIFCQWYIRKYNKRYKEPECKMSFRESLDLTELPIVTFYQGKTKINFILDTGSNISIIDKTFANKLQVEPNDLNVELVGVEGNSQVSSTGIVKIAYKDIQFEDTFQILDMTKSFKAIKDTTGVTVHGILGNAFFQKYQYVLDFMSMIAYTKK